LIAMCVVACAALRNAANSLELEPKPVTDDFFKLTQPAIRNKTPVISYFSHHIERPDMVKVASLYNRYKHSANGAVVFDDKSFMVDWASYTQFNESLFNPTAERKALPAGYTYTFTKSSGFNLKDIESKRQSIALYLTYGNKYGDFKEQSISVSNFFNRRHGVTSAEILTVLPRATKTPNYDLYGYAVVFDSIETGKQLHLEFMSSSLGKSFDALFDSGVHQLVIPTHQNTLSMALQKNY